MQRREVSVAFQSNKGAAEYAALARQVEEYGFDALSVYGDLMFQPPIGAADRHGAGDDAHPARPGERQSVHAAPR